MLPAAPAMPLLSLRLITVRVIKGMKTLCKSACMQVCVSAYLKQGYAY